MAQETTIQGTLAESNAPAGLTEKEIHEIQQYEKILRFRDTVLTGKHPSIKLPPGLKGLALSSSERTKPSLPTGVNSASLNHPTVSSANDSKQSESRPAPADVDGLVGIQTPQPRSFGSGATEINPILLEKSDDLIRAELQLQRNRLERALKEEVEQRRVLKHAQAEPLVLFDLSDVLAKALTLVQAATTPLPADDNLTANNEAASDSSDETFYSSHHDTPESHMTSRIRELSEEVLANKTAQLVQPPAAQPPAAIARNPPTSPRSKQPNHLVPATRQAHHSQTTLPANPPAASRAAQTVLVPGLNNYTDGGRLPKRPSQTTSGDPSQSEDSGIQEGEPSERQFPPSAPVRRNISYADIHPSPPLVRNHNLRPVAPQPAQISPLAVNRGEDRNLHSNVPSTVGTPAQVAALRNHHAVVTSPESSPHGARDSDKRKGKKKKRKADRQAPEAEPVPYIKPEPRSPSPMVAPSYIRPNKRQRQTQAPIVESRYGEPSFERSKGAIPYDQNQPRAYRDDRVPVAYESAIPYPQRAVSTNVIGDARYSREYVEERQAPDDGYVRRPGSPTAPIYQYPPRESHPPRAVSQVIVNDLYRAPSRLYREPLEASRSSVHPEGDSFMGPPKPPPARILVDAYGREYIEPPYPPSRQSMAPLVRPGEPEFLHERPPRALSGHPGPGSYEESGIVYARPPPGYTISRRFVTQPEYIPQDYRDRQHHRDYSTQPAGPSGEFVQVMAPQDRRTVEERPREYISRATSLRPLDPVRFDGPTNYGRMHSVRPEASNRDYLTPIHAETRHPEGTQPYMGEYNAGSVQQPVVLREYSVRPAERYHEAQGGVRRADEIAFIDGPRAPTQEIVYVDDARREVYR